jgi:tetratricopeptide (TPR) repeat protein
MKKAKSGNAAVANLPFGTVRFVFGKFSLVDVEPNREVFPEAAFAHIRRAAKGPDLTKALEGASMVALAEAKSRAGAHDEALAILEEASKLSDDAGARVAYGRIYTAKKDLPNAIKSFKSALERDEKSVAARLGLANALVQKNELVQAVEVLTPLEQGDVLVPQALLLLSRLRIKRGDYEGAARSLETLTEMQPNDGAPFWELGEAQHRLKRYDDALESYKKALKNGVKIPEKLSSIQALYIGRVEIDRGNDKRAQSLLKQAANGDDAVEESHFYLGKFLIKKPKQKKQGKKELELFRKLQPSGELSAEAEKLLR